MECGCSKLPLVPLWYQDLVFPKLFSQRWNVAHSNWWLSFRRFVHAPLVGWFPNSLHGPSLLSSFTLLLGGGNRVLIPCNKWSGWMVKAETSTWFYWKPQKLPITLCVTHFVLVARQNLDKSTDAALFCCVAELWSPLLALDKYIQQICFIIWTNPAAAHDLFCCVAKLWSAACAHSSGYSTPWFMSSLFFGNIQLRCQHIEP